MADRKRKSTIVRANYSTTKKNVARPLLEPQRNYDRAEGARAVGCSVITLIRAYDSGHLKAYRVGRRVLHSGQHLIDWLESGGRTCKTSADDESEISDSNQSSHSRRSR